jgi:adenylate cyclase
MRRAALGFGDQARRRSTAFYLGLAVLFTLAVAAGFVWSLTGPGIKSSSIDIAVRSRLSSPLPDPDILIVDIDERSLAQLAPEHGRWPWPRSVLAEQIAGLQAAGASAILLNLTLSDPDKDHPDDDATFAEVVRQVRPVAFPVTRLDPANDRLSQVAMTRFPGVLVRDRSAAAKPVALILPAFPDTFDRLGFNTLTVDPDGVIRHFRPWITEPGFAFPSQALRTLQLAGRASVLAPADPHEERILNWRNKRGDYARMSFSDVARALEDGKPAALAPFRGKIIILGASATGIGAARATAAKALTDDNTILATAMDDMLHGTQLRLVPAWATAGLSILVLFSLAAAFILRVNAGLINTIFVVLQSGFIVVTVYFASYTNYLIDISTTILLALAYFSIAKVYASIHLNATRGNPSFSAFVDRCGEAPLVIAGVSRKDAPPRRVRSLLRRAEKQFGVENVLHIDNLFSEGHALDSATRPYSFLLVSCRTASVAEAEDALRALGERERVALALGASLPPAAATAEGAADRPARVRDILKALLHVVDQMVGAEPVR